MLRRIEEAEFTIERDEIDLAISDLAAYIRLTYPNGCTIVGVLTGGRTVLELMEREFGNKRHLYPICYLGAASYAKDKPKPEVTLYGNMPSQFLLRKKNIVIVDDVIETGSTMKAIGRLIVERFKPKEIRTAALCVKGEMPEWISEAAVGFQLPKDGFIIGFGMDYNGHYRDLDKIMTITDEQREAAAVPLETDNPHERLTHNSNASFRLIGRGQVGADEVGLAEHQHSDQETPKTVEPVQP